MRKPLTPNPPGYFFALFALAATTLSCTRDASSQGYPEEAVGFSEPTLVAESGKVTVTREEALETLCQLHAAVDRDCDHRLTILDQRGACEHPPCALNVGVKLSERMLALPQLHHAAQLSTELAEGLSAARANGASTVDLDLDWVYQNPVRYLRRRIETRYWDGLTRRLSAEPKELWTALADEKQGADAPEVAAWCESKTSSCTQKAVATPSAEETIATDAAASASRKPANEAEAAPKAEEPGALEQRWLYVPESEPGARSLYSGLQTELPIVVSEVPNKVSPAWVTARTRTDSHGLLALARDADGSPLPFVVPGGRFNEMYGWDSYFITLGLLASGKQQLSRAMAEHQAYEITHYGKVLNANRTYYLTRSQPPFFPSLVRHVSEVDPAVGDVGSRGAEYTVWLERMLTAAEKEYSTVWSAAPRRTSLCEGNVCLARYYGEGTGQPPEVEPGHFAQVYQSYALEHNRCKLPPPEDEAGASEFMTCVAKLEEAYTSGTLSAPELDEFFVNDRCVRESGHDTTFRWYDEGKERCSHYATVDLNSLLLQYELDAAALSARVPRHQDRVKTWCGRAEKRAALLKKYLWNAKAGAFFDYDVARHAQSSYLAATTLYPLWVNPKNPCGVQVLSAAEAGRVVTVALDQLEAPGGLLASSPRSLATIDKPHVWALTGTGLEKRVPDRQWEAPNGWAPHQMIAWRALRQHGYGIAAQRLAYRWLLLIAENATNFNGTVPEKFDVVHRTHQVFAEYGNVNTDFAYIATQGFGWMNASFLVGQDLLTPSQRDALLELRPTESVFRSGPKTESAD